MIMIQQEVRKRRGRTQPKPAAAIVLGFLLVLSGCELLPSPYGGVSIVSDPANAEAVFANTTVSDDVHQRQVTVSAPLAHSGRDSYSLIAVLAYDENRRVQNQSYALAVHVFADDWLFLDRAYSYGRSLPVMSTDRELVDCYADGDCLINEVVVITLSRDDLARYAETGFAFEVTGSGGSREFFVPANYVAGFLRRVRFILGKREQDSAATAAPPRSSRPSARDSAARPGPTAAPPARRPAHETHRQPQRL